MQERSAGDLKQELMEQAGLEQYIVETDLTEVLARRHERCGLSKAELARQAEINDKLFSENEKTLF